MCDSGDERAQNVIFLGVFYMRVLFSKIPHQLSKKN